MKRNQRLKIIMLIFSLLITALLLKQSAQADDKVLTNADVYQVIQRSGIFKKTHLVMKRQHERLSLIFSSFLMGDTETIVHISNEIGKDINELALVPIPTEENKTIVWKSLAEISKEAGEMNEHVLNKQYDEAFVNFTNITVSCIRCHQTSRQWGKFPEIKPLPAEVETTSTY